MSSVRRTAVVDLPPAEAYELWTDVRRWSTFVDGFARVERLDPAWPEQGAKLVWNSPPAGRGTVTEKVVAAEPPDRFATKVIEERLTGTQTTEFAPGEDEGTTRVALQLDYKLQRRGPIAALTDMIFIRRAQSDALYRTLRRFATEAAEQAAL